MNLKNKKIVVVGASGGMGSVLCQKLLAEGAEVIPVTRQDADLTDPAQISQLINRLTSLHDYIDVLVNIAGIGIYKQLEDMTLSDWDTSFAINVRSVFQITQGLLPLLRKSPDSLILNIGSGMGVIPTPGRSLYCATKFALRGFILSIAEEFVGTQPKFCLITLGSTLTEFGPMTLEEKKKESLQGKAYFTPDWVANKLIETIQLDNPDREYTWYPSDYAS